MEAYGVSPERGLVRLSAELRGPALLPGDGFLWLDFTHDEGPGWAEIVREATGTSVDDNHVRDSLNLAHPSFCDATSGYEMLIFRGLAPSAPDARLASHPTAFFLLERVLVTVRAADSRSVPDVKARLLAKRGRIPRRPVGLMHLILNAIVDRFLDLRQALADPVAEWEETLLDPDDPFDDYLQVLNHRRKLRSLQTLCEDQETAVEAWRDRTRSDVDDSLAVRINDLLEHVRRVLSHARSLQEAAEALVQLHFAMVSHRTNEVMKTLTVVAAVFLPLTLVAGIFGMNFQNMPELQWKYGYLAALIGMGALASGLLLWFRRRRWI